MSLEGGIDFLAHGGGEAFATDHHHRVEVVGGGTVFLALNGRESDRGHCGIIVGP
jgi:hypothetical protein